MRTIQDYIEKLGYNTIPLNFYNNIELWNSWYKGKVESFHQYKVYNGIDKIKQERKSLCMAKKICEDKADLLLNEKFNVNISDEKVQEVVIDVLDYNDFWVTGNKLVELANALGTGAFVEYYKDGAIIIDTIKADSIFPLSWQDNKIKECAFSSEYMENGEKYTYLNLHVLEGENYVVINKILKVNNGGIVEEVQLPDNIKERFETNSNIALFQIISPNSVNNLDLSVPMGLSVFANSIDILKGIDTIYDSYINEFVLGRKRIFVKDSLLKYKPENDRIEPIFDTNDVVFNWWGNDDGNEGSEIKEIDLNLRINEHKIALQELLNLLSANCGFGKNHYLFEGSQAKTATEVISENSQLYRRIKKDEIVLEKALIDMVRAIIMLNNKVSDKKLIDDVEIAIYFDDSIIEDSSEIQQRALQEFDRGIIDGIEYMKKVYKLTEDQAIELVGVINERKPPVLDEYDKMNKSWRY